MTRAIAAQPPAAPASPLGQTDVFALLSHEIRTPLNGVLGMAGLLAATPLDATQAAYLQTLRECGEHLLGLVNDVLDLAKLQSATIELEPAPTDLEKLLQGVCELLSPRAHAQGLEIGWAVRSPAPVLLADDGRLRQILFNLVGNAVKMTPAGGVLAIAEMRGEAAEERVRVRFVVEDTGPGVDPADAARIFEPFVQSRDGERAGGAGLGLAVVKRLADAFGGEVGVIPSEGGGASFWFEADFEILLAPQALQAPTRGPTVQIRTASAVLRRAARLQLEACGAREARPDETPDVVLQDAGPELTPVASDAPPTLALLAPEHRAAITDLRANGYAGYLIKPLRRVSLAERLRAALDAARGPEQAGASGAAPPLDEREANPAARLGLRVLLAEDNAVNALLASALLTRRGCSVSRASSGAEALAALADAPFDLVLMDMRMPGMSGLEATRTLRANGCRTPVVALTANAFEDDRRACLEAGMDDFLSKPLDPAALDALFSRLALTAPVAVTK